MSLIFIRLTRIITESQIDDEAVNVQIAKIVYYQPDKFKERNCTFIALDDNKDFASGLYVAEDIVDIEERMQKFRDTGSLITIL